MPSVYPRAVQKTDVLPLDQADCAAAIIAAREASPKASKAHLVGAVLQGSDDVAGFEQAWDAVEAERKAMAAVNLEEHITRVTYEADLDKIAVHLDSYSYAEGVLDAAGVTTWNELQDKLSPAAAEL